MHVLMQLRYRKAPSARCLLALLLAASRPLACLAEAEVGEGLGQEAGGAAQLSIASLRGEDAVLPPPAVPLGGPHSGETAGRGGRLALRLPKEAFFGGASAGEAGLRRRFGGYGAAALPAVAAGEAELRGPGEELLRPLLPEGAHYGLAQLAPSTQEISPDPGLREPAARGSLAQLRPSSQGLSPDAGAQDSVTPPPGMQEYMLSQLEREQRQEAELRTENERLRGELARWRKAGSKVAEREARVVELVRRTGAEGAGGRSTAAPSAVSQADAAKGDEMSLLEESVQTYFFNGGKQPLADGPNSMRIILIFLSVNALAFLCWLSCGRAKGDYGNMLLQPALRRAGLGCYSIEISEIQVRNLPVNGDAYVSFQLGDKEQRTQSAEPSEGGLLAFEEALTLRVPSGGRGGACVCHVIDRDPLGEERIARLEVPTWELLRLVRRQHGEFFDFDLQLLPRQNRSANIAFAAPKSRQPCLALRMRDTSEPTAAGPARAPPAPPPRSRGGRRQGRFEEDADAAP